MVVSKKPFEAIKYVYSQSMEEQLVNSSDKLGSIPVSGAATINFWNLHFLLAIFDFCSMIF